MWRSLSTSIASFGSKKNLAELDQACCNDSSDDETSSNSDEGLECPICWESFNIVENIPYVLWCGHTLCKNCVLSLRSASVKFSTQQVHIPFFVSCPWCNLLTFRLVYNRALRFPSKNFFILWMVESRNGDRAKSVSSICRDHERVWSPNRGLAIGNNRNYNSDGVVIERTYISLQKSLDLLIRVMAKFPLIILLLIGILALLPTCVGILLVYMMITVIFALPAFLVLFFAYPALEWLVQEMRN